ncbi:hypothetical protein CGSMWGv1400E_00065 [Gardnerella vaginalis 1400E]|uniref:Uncharacterized protein n=1 Tax=Gardnerella vaginalis 1400E TaxID=698956 RepID=I4LZ41_GARVA|nr:hypothetical protein CGSMWGv1400E_00065 [Gardnerella vaginalis 1400E]
MSEMKVSPVLFKHAFLGGGHVITETVAGIVLTNIVLVVKHHPCIRTTV